MRHSSYIKFLSIVILLTFSSCSSTNFGNQFSVQKRLHRKGFHISSLKTNPQNIVATQKTLKEKQVLTDKNKDVTNILEQYNSSQAASRKVSIKERLIKKYVNYKVKRFTKYDEGLAIKSISKNIDYNNIVGENCDVIIFKNGDEISVKVAEVTETTVKYKKCDRTTGPIYTKSQSSILMIRYSDGTKDIFSFAKSNSKEEEEGTDKSVAYLGWTAFALTMIGTIIFWFLSWPAGFILLGAGLLLALISTIMNAANPSKYNKNRKGITLATLVTALLSILSGIIVLYWN